MDRNELIGRLEAALFAELGGLEVREWCERHYVEGEPLASIAADAGVNASTVHRRCAKMRRTLATYGLMPRCWRAPPPGPRERGVAYSRNDYSQARDGSAN